VIAAGTAASERRGDLPRPLVRAGHGAVVLVAGMLAAAVVAMIALGLSLCGLAGGRCEPEEVAAGDLATWGAVLTAAVTVVLVVLVVRAARRAATGAAALQVLVLGAALGASALLAASASPWADLVALVAAAPVPLLFRTGLMSP
jgi:hypothetical protein